MVSLPCSSCGGPAELERKEEGTNPSTLFFVRTFVQSLPLAPGASPTHVTTSSFSTAMVPACEGGGSFCEHGKRRSVCSVPACKGGGALCVHSKKKSDCPLCKLLKKTVVQQQQALKDANLVHWFAQNADIDKSPKISPIPIGPAAAFCCCVTPLVTFDGRRAWGRPMDRWNARNNARVPTVHRASPGS